MALPLFILLPSLARGETLREMAPPLPSASAEAVEAESRAVPEPGSGHSEEPKEDSHEGVEEIVVRSRGSASVFKGTVMETESLPWEELERTPATNVADVLRNLPGIRIQQRVQGQKAAVSIEGLPASYTTILVDGQRYADEIGDVNDLRNFPLHNVQRIEISRAAQGLQFGPGGGGGVINIITNPPPDAGGVVSANGGAGDDQNIQADGTVGYGNESMGGDLTFDYDRMGGFDAPAGAEEEGLLIPFGQLRTSYDLYGKFNWQPADALELRTRLGWMRRDEEFGDTTSSSVRTYTRWLFSQQADWAVAQQTNLRAAFTYFNGDTGSEVGRVFSLKDDEARLQFSVQHFMDAGPLPIEWNLGTDLSTTGLDLYNEAPEDVATKPWLYVPPIHESMKRAGFYLIAETEILQDLELDTGIRWQLTEGFEPFFTGHVALMWTPWVWSADRAVRVRASAGRNHRVPSLRELYQPPSPNLGGLYFLSGNEDLQPESANAYRLGLEVDPLEWLSFSISGFYNQIYDHIRSGLDGEVVTGVTNLISADPQLCSFGFTEWCQDRFDEIKSAVYRKSNLDFVTTKGVETRMRMRYEDYVELQLGYQFLKSNVDDSNILADELPNQPEHVVDGSLSVTLPVVETVLTGRARWSGPALIERSGTGLLSFVSNDYSDSSLDVDVRALQPIGENIELYFDLYNVTDNRVVDSYVVRGRSYFVGVRFRFAQ